MTDSKNAKRLSKEEIKKQLLESMITDENLKFNDLNKEAEEIREPEKAAEIIKQYEDIIKTKKKGVINVAFHQGQVFKRFKEKEKFVRLVSELGIHKIFKNNVFKLCEKYPKLLRYPKGLEFFKNIIRTLKQFARKTKKIFNIEGFCLLKLSLFESCTCNKMH